MALKLEQWIAGEGEHSDLDRNDIQGANIRLRINGNYIETNSGYRITLQEARQFFPAVLKALKDGSSTDFYIGREHGYGDVVAPVPERMIPAVPARVTVGCHIFDADEVLRIAAELQALPAAKPEAETANP